MFPKEFPIKSRGQVPKGKSVARAELQMEALIKNGRNNGEAMSIYFVKRPWDPAFVSWTEVSKGTLWTTAGGDFEEEEMSWSTAVPVGGQTVTWDVTGMVNAWMGGQKDNHGMLINSSHNAGGNGLNFVPKTRARMKQQGPRLYLTFK